MNQRYFVPSFGEFVLFALVSIREHFEQILLSFLVLCRHIEFGWLWVFEYFVVVPFG